jgi:hypothetical protein
MSAVGTLHSNANSSVPSSSNGAQAATQAADQTGVKSKEYYVKIPKNRKRFHALKFHTSNVDLVSWPKAEMTRETTNLPTYQRPEWEVSTTRNAIARWVLLIAGAISVPYMLSTVTHLFLVMFSSQGGRPGIFIIIWIST